MRVSRRISFPVMALMGVATAYLLVRTTSLKQQSRQLEAALYAAEVVPENDVTMTLESEFASSSAETVTVPEPLHLSASEREQTVALFDDLATQRAELASEESTLKSDLDAVSEQIAGLESETKSLEDEVTVLLEARRSRNLSVLRPDLNDASVAPPSDMSGTSSGSEAEESEVTDTGLPATHSELVDAYQRKRQELDGTRASLLLARGRKSFIENALRHCELMLEVNASRIEAQTEFIQDVEQLELLHDLPEVLANADE